MNRGELKAYVARRLTLDLSSDPEVVAQIEVELNQAYLRLVAEHRLYTGTTTIGVTAGSASVTLPSDLSEILEFRAGRYVLTHRSHPVLAEQRAALTDAAYPEGVFTGYTLTSLTTADIFPVPTETDAAALTLVYAREPAALDDDGDLPIHLPAAYHLLLAYMAIPPITLGEEDGGLADRALADADRMEARLSAYMTRRAGPGPRRTLPTALSGRRRMHSPDVDLG